MNTGHFILASALLLGGCASVTAIPLNVDGTRKVGAEGIRYYVPKPYLLVTELPEPPASAQSTQPNTGGGRRGGGGPGAPAAIGATPASNSSTGANGGGPSANTPTTNTPAAGATDTSYSASMASYSTKLIYLPDYSQPMALQSSTGLFGTVSVGPTLQDGWMLTGVTASIDSGAASTLSSIASIVSAGAGGAGTAAAGGASHAAGGGAATSAQTNQALTQAGFTQVQSALLMQLLASQPAAQNSLATWGEGVLQPGLYDFRYGENGVLTGLFPMMLFCGDGVVSVAKRVPDSQGKIALSNPPKCSAVQR